MDHFFTSSTKILLFTFCIGCCMYYRFQLQLAQTLNFHILCDTNWRKHTNFRFWEHSKNNPHPIPDPPGSQSPWWWQGPICIKHIAKRGVQYSRWCRRLSCRRRRRPRRRWKIYCRLPLPVVVLVLSHFYQLAFRSKSHNKIIIHFYQQYYKLTEFTIILLPRWICV